MPEKVETFYFTFGSGITDLNRNCFVKIPAESYEKAREKMNSAYGSKWSMQYSESEWNPTGQLPASEEYSIKEIPFGFNSIKQDEKDEFFD